MWKELAKVQRVLIILFFVVFSSAKISFFKNGSTRILLSLNFKNESA